MKTALYQVTKAGVVYGQYEAGSPQEALMAYAAEAGGSGTEMAVSDSGLTAVRIQPSRGHSAPTPRLRGWFEALNSYQAAAIGAAILALAIASWDFLK